MEDIFSPSRPRKDIRMMAGVLKWLTAVTREPAGDSCHLKHKFGNPRRRCIF